jgi:hypothetical protein
MDMARSQLRRLASIKILENINYFERCTGTEKWQFRGALDVKVALTKKRDARPRLQVDL